MSILPLLTLLLGLALASPQLCPNSETHLLECRRSVIRNMTQTAWNTARESEDPFAILSSLSSLQIMNLTTEFTNATEWVRAELEFRVVPEHRSRHKFSKIIRYLGSLTSAYVLTGGKETIFLEKAKEIAILLGPAFGPGVDLTNNTLLTHSPADLIQPELWYLSELIGPLSTFSASVREYQYYMKRLFRPGGVSWERSWRTEAEEFDQKQLVSLFGQLYYGILRAYLQSAGADQISLEAYSLGLGLFEWNDLFGVSPLGRYTFARNWNDTKSMPELGCSLGAMLALGQRAMEAKLQDFTSNRTIEEKILDVYRNRTTRHLRLAANLTETCHAVALSTGSGLLPGKFTFTEADQIKIIDPIGTLAPYLAESYFILWRLTKDTKYQDYAWQLVEAIHHHARTLNSGFSAIANVTEIPTKKLNRQPAEFLSGTLKYLYLTFTEDNVLSLDQWVFNSRGEPLPIRGRHPLYPEVICTTFEDTGVQYCNNRTEERV